MTRVKSLRHAIAKHPANKLLGVAGLGIGIASLIVGLDYILQSGFYRAIEQFAFSTGESYTAWFSQQTTANPAWLILLSFAGGLLASISPCILSLLPVNLSYIGTRDICSRRDALFKSGAFVLGVVTVLSLLGLFSAFAGVVFVSYRGYFHLAVGLVVFFMGLTLAGLVKVSLPTFRWRAGRSRSAQAQSPRWSIVRQLAKAFFTGPYGVGLTFALVSSPCTSPIMFSVLAVAAATGSQLLSVVMMISYALGYTAIIFLASLFTGLAKQTRGLLLHSEQIVRWASILLMVVGAFYIWNGGQWVLAMLA